MCKRGRLVHIPGSQGCLLPRPCSAGAQEVSLFCLHGGGVRVPVPAIRLLPGPFSKCVETALGPLRRQGKRVLFYLDDLLILSNSEEAARRDTMTVINHLSFLGFAINWEKSFPLPGRQIVYLGLCLDSAAMTAMLSPPRLDTILLALSRFCVRRNVTTLSTMCLLGLKAAAQPVVPLGLLFMRRLQRWFARQRFDPVRHKLRVLLLPRSVSPGPQDRGLLPQSTSAQRPSLVLQSV